MQHTILSEIKSLRLKTADIQKNWRPCDFQHKTYFVRDDKDD